MSYQVTLAGTIDQFKPEDLLRLTWPGIISPKFDGIRAHENGGTLYSRTFKPLPNRMIQSEFAVVPFSDGELIVGDPTDGELVYPRTESWVMTKNIKVVELTPTTYFVFDTTNPALKYLPYVERIAHIKEQVARAGNPYIQVAEFHICNSLEEFLEWEAKFVAWGYEGIMYRNAASGYEFRRAGWGRKGKPQPSDMALMKLKRFIDEEGEILELIEGEINQNPAFMSELGKTKRSTNKEGMKPSGMIGKVRVRGLTDGLEHIIPMGKINHETRRHMFLFPDVYIGKKYLKYRHMPARGLDALSLARAIGFRDKIDM